MLDQSRGYLLQEHESLWRYIEYLDTTRNKAVALYLVTLGALTGAVLARLGPGIATETRLYVILTSIPPLLLFPAIVFALLASVVTLLLSIRFRSLFIEYTYALNRVRRAFDREDPTLKSHLVLPTNMPTVRPGRYGAARQIHFFLIFVSALILWLGLMAGLYRLGVYGVIVPVAAVLLVAGWAFAFDRWYLCDEHTTVRDIWTRCPAAVHEEIAERAYQIFLVRRVPAQDPKHDWLAAEEQVRRQWGLPTVEWRSPTVRPDTPPTNAPTSPEKRYLVHPKGDPGAEHYTDIAMSSLFNAHVSTVNSERSAIWQRYNSMLLANSIVFGFLARQSPLQTTDLVFATLFGLALCAAWLTLTLSGWSLFNLWYEAGREFSWPKLDHNANPLEIGAQWLGRHGDPIFHVAWVVVILFMTGYLFLLARHFLP